jgi:hypothetical protein
MQIPPSLWGRLRAAAALLAVLTVVSACAAPPRLAYTAIEPRAAAPPGFADVRIEASEPAGAERLMTSFQRERVVRERPLEVLAISGGGANGAYGAGVLYGWSQSGTRPSFDIVTGISTGALAAPFAFLGQAYDDELKAGYTDGKASNILDFRGLLAIFRPSLFSGRPLENLVGALIDDALVAAVAKEHQAGRRLLIGTTNLDTQSLILWDMGAIAIVGGPSATQLFRTVLIASASIPGVFPPVMIEVESGSRRFFEMHVDGSAIASFFAVPEPLLLWTDEQNAVRLTKLHILVNGALDKQFAVTPNETLSILRRSVDAASKTNTRTELAAVGAFAARNNVDLRVSYVPAGVNPSPLNFDQARMSELFEQGRQLGASGQAWRAVGEDAP